MAQCQTRLCINSATQGQHKQSHEKVPPYPRSSICHVLTVFTVDTHNQKHVVELLFTLSLLLFVPFCSPAVCSSFVPSAVHLIFRQRTRDWTRQWVSGAPTNLNTSDKKTIESPKNEQHRPKRPRLFTINTTVVVCTVPKTNKKLRTFQNTFAHGPKGRAKDGSTQDGRPSQQQNTCAYRLSHRVSVKSSQWRVPHTVV